MTAEAHHRRGIRFTERERFAAAAREFRAALQMESDEPRLWNDLGLVLWQGGDRQEAIQCLERAVRLAPEDPDAGGHLLTLYVLAGRNRKALREAERLAELLPGDADALAVLGKLRRMMWDLGGSLDALRQAVRIVPREAQCWMELAWTQSMVGDVAQTVACCQKAVRLGAGPVSESMLLRWMCFSPDISPEYVAQRHREWGKRLYVVRAGKAPRGRSRPKKLRVGYVSGLFEAHSPNLLPVVEHHDRQRFEIYCFSDKPVSERVRWKLEANCRELVDTRELDNRQMAVAVAKRRIDILVDCDGHLLGAPRLPVFAMTRGTIRAAFSLYPNTTGLPAMDYQIVDGWTAPSGAERLHTEALVRLPVFHCCRPVSQKPVVNPLPALQRGYVTFGSFSMALKIHEGVVELWSRLLRAIPRSRLLLHHFYGAINGMSSPAVADRIHLMFERHGVEPARVGVVGSRWNDRHRKQYHYVDIALDPFPYSGCRTTYTALWMGVPVVTLPGSSMASRVSASMLASVDLKNWIASEPDEYVEIAASAASDFKKLARLRAGLRDRLARSPASDERAYVSALEDSYETMWKEKCGCPRE